MSDDDDKWADRILEARRALVAAAIDCAPAGCAADGEHLAMAIIEYVDALFEIPR